MLNIHKELPPCLFFHCTKCIMITERLNVRETAASSHMLFFVGICAKSFYLKTQESQGMYVKSGCQVVQSQGDLIKDSNGWSFFLWPSQLTSYTLPLKYLDVRVRHGTFRVSLKKEGARPSSNNAATWHRVSSKSCSDGREMGSVTWWIGFVSSYLAASLETRRSNRHGLAAIVITTRDDR